MLNPGDFANIRIPYRKSCQSVSMRPLHDDFYSALPKPLEIIGVNEIARLGVDSLNMTSRKNDSFNDLVRETAGTALAKQLPPKRQIQNLDDSTRSFHEDKPPVEFRQLASVTQQQEPSHG